MVTNITMKKHRRNVPVFPSNSLNLSAQYWREIMPNELPTVEAWDLQYRYGVVTIIGIIHVAANIFFVLDLLFTFIADKGCTMA